MVSRDPLDPNHFGKQNVGIYRMEVKGKRKPGLQPVSMHGLLAIISTKKRYGGFARAVGLRAMTTPHGLGYVKMVIMVDEDVDPFNLPQVNAPEVPTVPLLLADSKR